MLGSVDAVRELSGIQAEDFEWATAEKDVDAAITRWLVEITDWITEDRNRDFELDGPPSRGVARDAFSTDGDLNGRDADTGQTWTADAGMVTASGVAEGAGLGTVPHSATGAQRVSVDGLLPGSDAGSIGVVLRQADADNRLTVEVVVDTLGTRWIRIIERAGGMDTVLPLPLLGLNRESVTLEATVSAGRLAIAVPGQERMRIPVTDTAGAGVGIVLGGDAQARSFAAADTPAVPAAVHGIANRAGANMAGQAVLRKNTPLVRIDELTVQMVEYEVFDQPIRDDLKRWARIEAFGIAAFTGQS